MKIWLVIFFIGIVPLRMISQDLTPAERQQIIAKLDSSDEDVRFEALDNIYKYKISEALPKIEQNFWMEDVPHQEFSFMALEAFNSTNLHTLAKAFYDSAEILAKKEPFIILDPLRLKVTATYYLHQTGDYSTTPCIFEYLRRGNKTKNPFPQKTLKSVIKNVPEFADSAKLWLIRITQEPDFMASQIKAMYDLVELYGKEMFPVIVNMVVESSDAGGGSRLMALELLYKMNYSGLHDLLKDRLSKEVAPAYRGDIADSLLLHYGGIEDYILVKNYINQEVNPTTKSLMEFSIRDFTPVKPNIMLSITQLIDSLASCLQQVAMYGWIGDGNFITEANGYFVTAENKINISDSLDCARQIRIFQQRINEEYVDSLDNDGQFATIDGWKFLYYNAQYILDRLPQILPESVTEMLDTVSTRLQQAYTNGWIGERLLVQILDRSVQNAKSRYTAKDSIGCAQEIENFYKIVRLKYLATLKMRGRQFVTVEAYNLLYSYAKGIIGKVLTLPPRSSVSLIDQITALRVQIRTDASQGLIGGELLLRGLESSLDRAKQKLQKDDSTGTALYVTLFQQTVRQVYALTKKLSKSRLYVKPGGYISLYYRAGYILEGLLEPVGQPMPKMDSALEEELRKYEKEAK